MKEYYFDNLKALCSSSISCKYDGTYVLEPKFGKISLLIDEDFSYIDIYFKRVSGNGKIKINGENYTVSSKQSEVKTILSKEKNIRISRTEDSLGEVAILGIEINASYEEDMSIRWKSIVRKFHNYKGLSLVKDTLFANEGAFIEPSSFIIDLETEPANAYSIQNNKIVFSYKCKVTNINLTSDILNSDSLNKKELFISRDPPNPLPQNDVADYERITVNNGIGSLNQAFDVKKEFMTNSHPAINIVYDSDKFNGFIKNNFKEQNRNIKFIASNGRNYVSVKPGAIFSIPISSIQPNKKYTIIFNGKKFGGNGRLKACISNSKTPDQYVNLLFGINIEDRSINIGSGEDPDFGSSYKLNVGVFEDGNSEILISRIIIVEALDNVRLDSFADVEALKTNQKVEYTLPVHTLSTNLKGKNKFVIVIPSYKNQEWAEKNILSALNQNYSNFRVLFTDDCSPDNTFDAVLKAAENHPNKNKATIVRNEVRKGALENLYNMIHSCDDDEIVLTLDGDDWLAGPEVLNTLNIHYSGDVWMTYGQYQNYPDGGRGVAQQIPDHVIKTKNYRQHTWCSSHLRTFYAWLFKQIKKEDLFYEGKFMAMTWDMAMMFPMLEMSGHRSKFISEYLYIYNLVNPINDHKVNQKLQQKLDRLVRGMHKYPLLAKEPAHVLESRAKNPKNKIGLLVIATGKYDQFITQLIESADKFYFKDPNFEVTYFIFTDKEVSLNTSRNYKVISIEHRGFPYASMDRFKHFTNNSEELSKMDYLYYVDVDCKFVDHVSAETLGELVGVRHCGYFNGGGTFEENKNSVFYIDPKKYKYYFGGGFSGGSAKSYLELSRWCYEMIERDLQNNIIPTWHDETALNRYFLDHEPETVLTPSYHYPENYSSYIAKWRPHKFSPKIMFLEKNHKAVR